jgi:hypothetical protein
MTPKEKAEELVEKYFYLFSVELENTIDYREAKQCALIAVDELIKEAYFTKGYIEEVFFTDGYYDKQDYWQEVKQEIEKL